MLALDLQRVIAPLSDIVPADCCPSRLQPCNERVSPRPNLWCASPPRLFRWSAIGAGIALALLLLWLAEPMPHARRYLRRVRDDMHEFLVVRRLVVAQSAPALCSNWE